MNLVPTLAPVIATEEVVNTVPQKKQMRLNSAYMSGMHRRACGVRCRHNQIYRNPWVSDLYSNRALRSYAIIFNSYGIIYFIMDLRLESGNFLLYIQPCKMAMHLGWSGLKSCRG